MTTEITDAQAAAEATAIANGLADAGTTALSLLGFTMTEPAAVQVNIGTDDHPDEARIILTWPLPPQVRATLAEASTPPPPTFPHGIYGVNLTLVGDEGAMMAEGHVPLVRFVAACNNLSRNEFGCRNLLDYSEATLTEALEGARHTWVLPTGNPDGDCDWYVKYDATAETPGAVPVTLWEP